MVEKTAWQWILLDGAVPLFGAAALYWFWGFVRYLTSSKKRNFKYSWKEGLDSFGWLYGGLILSVQTIRWTQSFTYLDIILISAAIASVLFLLSAMVYRGEDDQWKPPRSLQVVSILLIVGILCAGWNVRASVRQPPKPAPPKASVKQVQ